MSSASSPPPTQPHLRDNFASSVMFSNGHRRLKRSSSEGGSKELIHSPAQSLEKYGWFEDFEQAPSSSYLRRNDSDFALIDDEEEASNISSSNLVECSSINTALSLPLPATDPPSYILESPLSSQYLWYTTAGQRPQQPPEERKQIEEIWKENFEASNIPFPDDIAEPSKKSYKRNENVQSLQAEYHEDVRGHGKGPFSNAVSKSFLNHCISSMTIQVPRYKVVRPHDSYTSCFHAQFLIVISLCSSVPHGVWRRHSDFKNLFDKIRRLNNTPGPHYKVYNNTILSWQCVLSRQRWYRCLEKKYLSLKCFLIERFMQDLLFESPTPDVINEFLGLHNSPDPSS